MLRTPFVGRAAVLILGASLSTCAWAAMQRSFVASTGDDTNACSIPAPCRSFARAITQTDANGEIIVLDSAGYGAVVVDKSVAIIAPAGVYAGISVFTGDGILINGSGIEVVLRGLTINGQGGDRGIVYTLGARLNVEHCIVRNMTSHGIRAGFGGVITIEDSAIRDNGGSGISVIGDPHVVVSRSSIEGNNIGIYFGPSFGAVAKLVVVDSLVARNASQGIYVFTSGVGAAVTVAHTTVARNGGYGIGLVSQNMPLAAALDNNTIVHNVQGVVAESASGLGTVSGALTGSFVADNVFQGVLASNTGALLVLDRNTVTRNDTGVLRLGSAVIETRSNNTVRENGTNTSGGPFTAVGGT